MPDRRLDQLNSIPDPSCMFESRQSRNSLSAVDFCQSRPALSFVCACVTFLSQKTNLCVCYFLSQKKKNKGKGRLIAEYSTTCFGPLSLKKKKKKRKEGGWALIK